MTARTEAAIVEADPAADRTAFRDEIVRCLRAGIKTIPAKYLYDARGAELFGRICELDEYYLTRTEVRILRDHAEEMASMIGPGCVLVECGGGSGLKTRTLLDYLQRPAAYMPLDVSQEQLNRSVSELVNSYPKLAVVPILADFTRDPDIQSRPQSAGRTVVYIPGSTIGNFERGDARELLRWCRVVCGADGVVLVAVDLEKDRDIVVPAYDDSAGVTAAFTLNVLHRMNRELGANFRLDQFEYRVLYNESEGRVEMYLRSLVDQTVDIGGEDIAFRKGECARTEYSYKYSRERFADLAASAGLSVRKVWTDPDNLFSIQYLTVG